MSSAIILCLDQYSSLGGAQQSLLDLLPAFHSRGWQTHVAIPQGGPLTEAFRRQKVPVHTLNSGSYTLIEKSVRDMLEYACTQPGLIAKVAHLVQKNRIELIYANGPRILPAAAFVSRLFGVPLLFHSHNRLLQRSAVFLSGVALKWARCSTIACCRFAAEPLLPFLDTGRIEIIFNGVADMSSPGCSRADQIRRIGVIGRIEKEKGQLEFVRAARTISANYPDCSFHVIGASLLSGAEYHDHVLRQSAGLNIQFHGWTDNVKAAIAQLDLLIVPSTNVEATTRVILEAFSAGLPVIAFPSGGIVELLQDNKNGFLTHSSTHNALGRRTLEVLHMPPNAVQAVTAAARRSWEQHFTLAAYQARVCSEIERLLTQKLAAKSRRCWPELRCAPKDTAVKCSD